MYNLYPLDFSRPSVSYSIDGGTNRFAVESAIGIIYVRFSMRTILTETFRRIFLSGYSDEKHLRDDLV